MRISGDAKDTVLKREELWRWVRGRAHAIFPFLGVVMVALILTSPLYPNILQFVCQNAFARFCLFWCLAVCVVLSFANKYTRPSTVAIISTAIAAVIFAAFYCIYYFVLGAPEFSTFLLSCLAGAILGALAGNWLIYVLEVYVDRR